MGKKSQSDLLLLTAAAIAAYYIFKKSGENDNEGQLSSIQILAGTSYSVNVTVKNTGNVQWTYWVGASNGLAVDGFGCGLYFYGAWTYDLPLSQWKSITLSPGQSGTVTLTMPVPGLGESVICKLWKNHSDPMSGDPNQGCLDGDWQTYSTTLSGQVTITGIL